MTIKALLQKGVLSLNGRENSILDAEVLLAYVLGVNREYLLAHDDEEVENGLEDLFDKYLDRLKSGEPVAYIVQEKEFYSLPFFVDSRVLVPRPETEMIVDKVLEFIDENRKEDRKFRILDIGTGSCNIPIAIAKSCESNAYFIDAIEQIDAVDVSEEALEVARINIDQYNLEHLIFPFQSNLLENIEQGARYDLIVANLPYIGEKSNNFVAEGVKKFEPNSALFAGDDGLKLYREMFKQIKDKEIDYKLIVGEFGFGQRKELEPILNEFFGENWKIEKDLAGTPRIFIVNS